MTLPAPQGVQSLETGRTAKAPRSPRSTVAPVPPPRVDDHRPLAWRPWRLGGSSCWPGSSRAFTTAGSAGSHPSPAKGVSRCGVRSREAVETPLAGWWAFASSRRGLWCDCRTCAVVTTRRWRGGSMAASSGRDGQPVGVRSAARPARSRVSRTASGRRFRNHSATCPGCTRDISPVMAGPGRFGEGAFRPDHVPVVEGRQPELPGLLPRLAGRLLRQQGADLSLEQVCGNGLGGGRRIHGRGVSEVPRTHANLLCRPG